VEKIFPFALFAPLRDTSCWGWPQLPGWAGIGGKADRPAFVSPLQNGRPGFQSQGKGFLGKSGIDPIIAKTIGQVKS